MTTATPKPTDPRDKPFEARCAACGHSRRTRERSWFRPQGWSFVTAFCPRCKDERWIVVERSPQPDDSGHFTPTAA